LADRVMQADEDSDARLLRMFRMLTSRTPSEAQRQVLRSLYDQQQTAFAADPDAAGEFLQVGDHRADENSDPAELAALTVVAQTLLNYDETVMKR
jgi:hypothetical protein